MVPVVGGFTWTGPREVWGLYAQQRENVPWHREP